ncbi:MAG: hypothetical protein A2Z34_12000 [Planctomycetes bacterium RBG_16_59_8]|nr:MAG: hypothetical protein A2Z34_12000 [Planctomycetes bacterium RBG_16_59_8]
MSIREHHRHAKEMPPVRCRILIVSDRRTEKSDESGALASALLERKGHVVAGRAFIPNKSAALSREIRDFLKSGDDLLLTVGGTGISARDLTADIVGGFLEKRLEGFGELFRRMSFREIGTGAILSRALLGTARRKLLCSIPGSPAAVRLAVGNILARELAHLAWELKK